MPRSADVAAVSGPARAKTAAARSVIAFPPIRFPVGVAAPVIVLVVGLLVTAVTAALVVQPPAPRSIPEPVLSAQRVTAAAAAADVVAQADRLAATVAPEVTRLAATLDLAPADGLAGLDRALPALSAVGVLDAATGAPLAARGVLPMSVGLPPGRAVVATDEVTREPRAVVAVPVGANRRVVVATALRLPAAPPGIATAMMSTDGTVLAGGGGPPVDRVLGTDVLDRVAARAEGTVGGDVVDSGALDDPDRDPRLPVASGSFSAVSLLSAAGTSPGVATAGTRAAPAIGPPDRPGLALGLVLAAVAVLAGETLRRGLVRPVRRLRADSDAALAGPGPGIDVARVRRSRVREVDALASAFRRRADATPGANGAHPRLGVHARAVCCGVAVTVILCCGFGLALADRLEVPISTVNARYIDQTRRLADEAAAAVVRRLDQGVERVRVAAALQTTTGLVAQVDTLAAAPGLFRSVSVVDRAGATLYTAGRPPLRTVEPPPPGSGIRQLNTMGRLPVVVAHAEAGAAGVSLVAEYDVVAFSDLLRRGAADVQVVDSGHRTILGSQGFEAFSPVADPEVADVAAEASRGVSVVTAAQVEGEGSALVAVPLGSGAETLGLGWVLLAERSLSSSELSEDPAARAAYVVTGVAAALAVTTLAWTWLVVLAPLRRAGRGASHDGGDLPVERLDEVGAVVANLHAARNLTPTEGHR